MEDFLLPLANVPQRFEIALAGVNYVMTVRWNDADEGGWVMDLADVVTGDPIVANIPLVVGENCLSGLNYLGIQGEIIVVTDGNEFADPTLENLGIESNAFFRTDVAVNG
jgi:hypothetical protein